MLPIMKYNSLPHHVGTPSPEQHPELCLPSNPTGDVQCFHLNHKKDIKKAKKKKKLRAQVLSRKYSMLSYGDNEYHISAMQGFH